MERYGIPGITPEEQDMPPEMAGKMHETKTLAPDRGS